MDARVCPALLPAIQIRLRFFQTLEAHPFERRFLGVADPRLYFPFAIRILDPARQRHYAIVGEHIAKKWINRGIVNVRNQDAFFQVVENDDPRTTTESAKGFLMEFGPDARTRPPRQQTNAFAAVSQGQHEQPGPPVLPGLRVADQGAAAVIDLGFFPWLGEDDPRCLGQLGTTKPADETLYGLVVAWITVVRHQVLPDGLGISTAAQFPLNEVTVGFAGTDPARGGGWGLR